MAAFQIGRDYRGTLSGVKYDGVTATAGSVTWTLYDDAGDELDSGTGDYVSPGQFEYVIESSVFAAMGPAVGKQYRLGRLHVTVSQGGVDGSFGGPAYFCWPTATAG